MLIASLIDLYSLIVLIAVFLSWAHLDPRSPFVVAGARAHRAGAGADPPRAAAAGRHRLVADAAADGAAAGEGSLL